MKKLTVFSVLFIYLLVANTAFAVPKRWSLNGTVTVGADGSTISGSFMFDQNTDTLSDVDNVIVNYQGNGEVNLAEAALVDTTYLRGVVCPSGRLIWVLC